MKIDWTRVRTLETAYSKLDPMDAYYRQRQIDYEHRGPIVPDTTDVLLKAARHSKQVLDIGCGDGATLVAMSPYIEAGVGFDESEYVLRGARARAMETGAANLRFVRGKAVDLPFEPGEFDLVFSERGPIGHADITLVPALEILRPGGRIFYETLIPMRENDTLLTTLDQERDRLERHEIEVEVLCARVETLWFRDVYQWIELQCSIERYYERGTPYESISADRVEAVRSTADPKTEEVHVPYRTIWAGGMKR